MGVGEEWDPGVVTLLTAVGVEFAIGVDMI